MPIIKNAAWLLLAAAASAGVVIATQGIAPASGASGSALGWAIITAAVFFAVGDTVSSSGRLQKRRAVRAMMNGRSS